MKKMLLTLLVLVSTSAFAGEDTDWVTCSSSDQIIKIEPTDYSTIEVGSKFLGTTPWRTQVVFTVTEKVSKEIFKSETQEVFIMKGDRQQKGSAKESDPTFLICSKLLAG